jgi:hypothetical protein
MLYQSTCVGLRYGRVGLARGFSWQLGLNHLRALGLRHHPSDSGGGFAYHLHRPTGLAPESINRLVYPPASPLRSYRLLAVREY